MVGLFQSFMASLVQNKHPQLFADVVDGWIAEGMFEQSFITMISRGDNLLTLNLIVYVNKMSDKALKELVMATDSCRCEYTSTVWLFSH